MFDSHPMDFRGNATTSLRQFMETTKGKCLCVSLLLDESTQPWKQLPLTIEKSPVATEYNICSKNET